jgi:hypothetical protein
LNVTLWSYEFYWIFPDKFNSKEKKYLQKWFWQFELNFFKMLLNTFKIFSYYFFASFMSIINSAVYDVFDNLKIPQRYEQFFIFWSSKENMPTLEAWIERKSTCWFQRLNLILFADDMDNLIHVSCILGMSRRNVMLVHVAFVWKTFLNSIRFNNSLLSDLSNQSTKIFFTSKISLRIQRIIFSYVFWADSSHLFLLVIKLKMKISLIISII